MLTQKQKVNQLKKTINAFTSGDFKEFDRLNRQGDSTTIPTLATSQYSYIKLAALKAFYVAKFNYIGDTDNLDTNLLDEHLFQYGTAAIVKMGKDEFAIGSYNVKKYDYNNKPKVITFIPIRELTKDIKDQKALNNNQEFKVGEDVVIFNNSPSLFINGNNTIYRPYFRAWELLKDLNRVYTQIHNEVMTQRSMVSVPANTTDELYENLNAAIFSGKPIVKIGHSFGKGQKAYNGIETAELFDMKNRLKELQDTWHFIWEQILTIMGCDSNVNNLKRERQSEKEIMVNNDFSNGINEAEMRWRQKGFDMLSKTWGINISCALRVKEEEKEEKTFESSLNNQDNGIIKGQE